MAVLLSDALKAIGIYNDKVDFYLPAPIAALAINDDGATWTKVPGMTCNGSTQGYSSTGGTLKKTDNSNCSLMIGVSDVAVNKACTIFYGLSINGSTPLLEHITEATFTAASKVENIVINKLPEPEENQEFEVWVLGDGIATGVAANIKTLSVIFWGK